MGSLNGILAVLAAIVGAFSIYKYMASADIKIWIVIGVIAIIAFLAFAAMFMSGRMNKTDDIHITE